MPRPPAFGARTRADSVTSSPPRSVGQSPSLADVVKMVHPRPSAAGTGYDAANSAGTNFGPTNKKLIEAVTGQVEANVKAVDWVLSAEDLAEIDRITK